MNREIEFRAWDVENKIMVYDNENDTYGYWDGCQDSDLGMINHLLNRKEYIFMQYTGLKDKNGKEIFEGDIVKNTLILENNTFATNIDIVEYNQEECSFMLGKGKRHFNKNLDLEVIGNIYEDNLESKGE